MARLRSLFALLAGLALIGGCDGPTTPQDAATDDGGRDSGMTDVCEGRALCATAGTSCDGDTLVTCEEDADGCLVETSTDCGASDQICDASGGTAACIDPCSLIPAADRCETDGERACNADSLEVCTMDAQGCLVLERTDCAASPGGVCDESGTMPVCALPTDACAAIPEADRCTTAGTSCDGDSLVECAPDAFGCLVVTRTDCTSRAGGTCDATGTAACVFTGDPCDGVTQCAAEGTSCDGPELVECALDAFGCLVETRTTCTDVTFGFCDESATPSATCSTAATDPCMGITECAGASRTCTDRSMLDVCAANAFGCFVATTTDCTASSEVCSDADGPAVCVDPCSLITTCPSASYCDGSDVVTCTADGDGCLVESARSTCTAPETCDASAGTAACADTICPEAGTRVLGCASGTVSGDTAMGTMVNPGDYGTCASGTSYGGREQYWRFQSGRTGPVLVTITSAAPGTTRDFDLFVLDGGDGTATCLSGAAGCLDSSRLSGAAETVEFAALPGETDYVAFDLWDTPTDATTTYDLTVTCVDIVCGDGLVHPGEACDDGNTADGDGCSAACTVETGYACTGEPSSCDPLPTHTSCAAARVITADAAFTNEPIVIGGPRPTGTGCGTSSGDNALYYAVTIPPNTSVAVATSGSLDRVILVQDSCAATTCEYRTDSSPESWAFSNTTASPVTKIVVVHNFSSSGSAPFDISFAYSPTSYALSSVAGACVDASAGTVVADAVGDDASSAVNALPFSFTYFGDAMSHWSVSTNGLLQLHSSASGTTSTAYVNRPIPNATAPNGMIAAFWDDLEVTATSDIRTLTSGTAGSQLFVVEWNDVLVRSVTGSTVRFQAHLYEGTNVIELHYCAASGTEPELTGSFATVGIESPTGLAGVGVSLDAAGATSVGTGYRFAPM